jgi:hypothetical protein
MLFFLFHIILQLQWIIEFVLFIHLQVIVMSDDNNLHCSFLVYQYVNELFLILEHALKHVLTFLCLNSP